MESFHRNASIESEGSSSTDEEFKGFHQYEIKYNNLPRNIRTSVRKLERAYKRLVKVSGKVMFNDLCLSNNFVIIVYLGNNLFLKQRSLNMTLPLTFTSFL